MQIARLKGLTPDGKSLIVTGDDGAELSIAVDARLHAAMNGDRPRLGQLEIEMNNTLSPREIQARIRGGASVNEVAEVAGVPLDRVERFAAPVLAEREHVATQAMSATIRRHGETSGHRKLRIAVTERLVGRGLDPEALRWDARRREDGRWTVTALNPSDADAPPAEFTYDPRARFSVAANDEARWLVGEAAPPAPTSSAAPPRADAGVHPDGQDLDGDNEPTVDLGAGWAAVHPSVPGVGATAPSAPESGPHLATVSAIRPAATAAAEAADPALVDSGDAEGARREDSPLDVLDQMLDGPTSPAEPPPRGGLSDASAVPVTPNSLWTPAGPVDFPVEPSVEEDEPPEAITPEASPEVPPEEPDATENRPLASTTGATDKPEETQVQPAGPVQEDLLGEPVEDTVTLRRPAKKKRASVPSWDEIMFGGPRPRP